ncbi:hypothetical protein PAHAL_8G167200 [Panicum hallii]|uniref:No apical meristem-associated C-terminal domain-containing protein n=1 Tax=Panicum hallii TaxID=206008 RepID=A0A2T8I943_9POAL|nr:hypothetical protein PAHAL_8G167200 [Panicum hallii]
MANTLSRDEENDAPAIERSGQQRPAALKNKQEKELKRPRKNENIVGMMGAYLEMRTKQVEAEAADRAKEMEERERETREREAREKDAAQASNFLIRRCISVLNCYRHNLTGLEVGHGARWAWKTVTINLRIGPCAGEWG